MNKKLFTLTLAGIALSSLLTANIASAKNINAVEHRITNLKSLIARLETRLNALKQSQSQAPVISDISIKNATSTKAVIKWETDKRASGKVYYSTVSPLNPQTASSTVKNNLSRKHSLKISNLNPNTQYFFLIESRDAFGNTATSTQRSFTTSAR